MLIKHVVTGTFTSTGYSTIGHIEEGTIELKKESRAAACIRFDRWSDTQEICARMLELQPIAYGRHVLVMSETHQISNQRPINFSHYAEVCSANGEPIPEIEDIFAYRGFVNIHEFRQIRPQPRYAGELSSESGEKPEKLLFLEGIEREEKDRLPDYEIKPQNYVMDLSVRGHLLIDYWKRIDQKRKGKGYLPLFLVLTEDYEDVFAQGISFLRYEILPYLPSEIKGYLSYSMGIKLSEVGNFMDSACIVLQAEMEKELNNCYDFVRQKFHPDTEQRDDIYDELAKDLALNKPLKCMNWAREISNSNLRGRILSDYELTVTCYAMEKVASSHMDEEKQGLFYERWIKAYDILTGPEYRIFPAEAGRFLAGFAQALKAEEDILEGLDVCGKEGLAQVLACYPGNRRGKMFEIVENALDVALLNVYFRRAGRLSQLNSAWNLTWEQLQQRALRTQQKMGHDPQYQQAFTAYAESVQLSDADKERYIEQCMCLPGVFDQARLARVWVTLQQAWLNKQKTSDDARPNAILQVYEVRTIWEKTIKLPQMEAVQDSFRGMLVEYVCKGKYTQKHEFEYLTQWYKEAYFDKEKLTKFFVANYEACLLTVEQAERSEIERCIREVWTLRNVPDSCRSQLRAVISDFLLNTLHGEVEEKLKQLFVDIRYRKYAGIADEVVLLKAWMDLYEQCRDPQIDTPASAYEQLKALLQTSVGNDLLVNRIAHMYCVTEEDRANKTQKYLRALELAEDRRILDVILKKGQHGDGWKTIYYDLLLRRFSASIEKAQSLADVLTAYAEFRKTQADYGLTALNDSYLPEFVESKNRRLVHLCRVLNSPEEVKDAYFYIRDHDLFAYRVREILSKVYLEKLEQLTREPLGNVDIKNLNCWKDRVNTAVAMQVVSAESLRQIGMIENLQIRNLKDVMRVQYRNISELTARHYVLMWKKIKLEQLQEMEGQYENRISQGLLCCRDLEDRFDWELLLSVLRIRTSRMTVADVIKLGHVFRVLDGIDEVYGCELVQWMPRADKVTRESICACFPTLERRHKEESLQMYGVSGGYLLWLKATM